MRPTSAARWATPASAAGGGCSEAGVGAAVETVSGVSRAKRFRAPQEARRDNPEVVWFKSHPRNHLNQPSNLTAGFLFYPILQNTIIINWL